MTIQNDGEVSSVGVAIAGEATRVRSQSALMASFYDLSGAGQERENKDCVSEARQSLLSCLWSFV